MVDLEKFLKLNGALYTGLQNKLQLLHFYMNLLLLLWMP